MSKTTYEVREGGRVLASRDAFQPALKVYEEAAANNPSPDLELVRITEERLLSTTEKLSSERGYASKHG